MNFQNFLSPFNIWQRNINLPVKTPRTQQCRIQNIRSVCCGNYADSFHSIEAIHFYQQLVKCLFTLIISTAHSRASAAANSIYFVDKNNTGCVLSSLFKHITNSTGTDANKHFHKIRTTHTEKRNFCLTGNSLCQQSFPCTRRSGHQHTFGDSSSEFSEFGWVL